MLDSGVNVPLFTRLPERFIDVEPNDKFLVELIWSEFKLNVPEPEKVTVPSITIFPVPPSNVTPFATLIPDLITTESPDAVLVPEPENERVL